MRECTVAIAFYVGLAVLFGLGVLVIAGGEYAGEFYAGWLTEYSLSIDNLFVFVIIMARFQVPRQYQQTALLVGIILALVMRGIFIAVGAAAIQSFSWVFYLFGAFLVYTAVKLATQGESGAEDFKENRLLTWVERRFAATTEWNGVHVTARVGGRRVVTPMLLVILALGTTDLLFALDSIPAIYGLTKEPYLVFTANVFALMGLRQLYFLIGGLLRRLVYLSLGLSVVLGFIGVKLVLEALHTNELPFVNGGEHVGRVPEIPIWLSLVVILGVLAVTTVASLLTVRHDPSAAESPERR
jgi:tellurite resistance protein TerC